MTALCKGSEFGEAGQQLPLPSRSAAAMAAERCCILMLHQTGALVVGVEALRLALAGMAGPRASMPLSLDCSRVQWRWVCKV